MFILGNYHCNQNNEHVFHSQVSLCLFAVPPSIPPHLTHFSPWWLSICFQSLDQLAFSKRYKWNHPLCTLLGLVSCTQQILFEIHPCYCMNQFYFFFLSSIPLCEHTSLSIHLLIGVSIVYNFGLLQIK